MKQIKDFFTDPTVLDIDLGEIGCSCENSRDSLQVEMEAWSELGGQVVGAEVPQSAFARELVTNPELAARCEKVVTALRKLAADDVAEGDRAQKLTAKDLAVTINATTPVFH